MAAPIVNKEQLLMLIRKDFQEAQKSVLEVVNLIKAYLEDKYNCEFQYLQNGERMTDSKTGEQYIYVAECKLKIRTSSGDVEVIPFLTKVQLIVNAFDVLDNQIGNLPGYADDIVDAANMSESRANSLLNTAEDELKAMDQKIITKIENNLVIVATDMSSIKKNVKELVASLA